jgi:hypothetical protein
MRYAFFLTLVLVSISSATFGQDTRSYQRHRTRLLRELKKCEPAGRKPGCNERNVLDVARLYDRGDRSVLKDLMDVVPNSDAALSEALGDFFSELLCKRPRTFLAAVSKRPRREHHDLLSLAAVADGGGMDCRNIRALRQTLNAIKRNPREKLRRLAGECLLMVNKYNSGMF